MFPSNWKWTLGSIYFGDQSFESSKVRLKTYTGHAMQKLCARYDNHQADVVIQVVSGDGPNHLGRDLLPTGDCATGIAEGVQSLWSYLALIEAIRVQLLSIYGR